MAKGKPVSIRFPEDFDVTKLEGKADMLGMSRSDFVMTAIEILMDMDPNSYIKIKAYSNRIGAPVGVIMQNAIIRDLGEQAAETDTFGLPKQRHPIVIKKAAGEYAAGDELFLSCYRNHLTKCEYEDRNRLLRDEAERILDDEGRAKLIKYRAGNAWLESKEYQEELALQEKYKLENEVDLK
jgi:hypothetical protein